MSNEIDHPIKKGSKVRVMNRTLGRKIILEGIATIVKPHENMPDCYFVRFYGDRRPYSRFVPRDAVVD